MYQKSPPATPPILRAEFKVSMCSVELHDTEPFPPARAVCAKDEMRVRRKLDFYLMPVLVLGFLALQLDRSNLANALTNTLRQDLDLSLAQVNTGTQLLQAGIIIAEIPANIILQRLGARVWLTFLLAIWGTVTLTQAFMTDVHSFYATRFLLGVFEGGYIPGSQYVLALFYKSDELALRTAIFYVGNYAAAGTGSLIAAGILEMHGIANLSGWRWLFILEGAFTIVVSFVFLLLMPESPSRTKPLHGQFDIFTKEERDVLQSRISHSDASKWESKATITWATLRDALWNVRPWLHMLLNAVAQTPKGALQLYSPSIIRSLGFDQLHSNLLNSVSSYGVVVLSIIISIASDKFKQRGMFCIVACVWSIVFCGALVAVRTSGDKWLRYAILTLLGSGNALAQALNDVWLSINSRTAHGRSIGLAMVVMGSNIGGLVGPQLFQPGDAPLYTRGFIAILCFYSVSIVVVLVIMFVYWRDNKKLERQEGGRTAGSAVYEI